MGIPDDESFLYRGIYDLTKPGRSRRKRIAGMLMLAPMGIISLYTLVQLLRAAIF